MSATSGLVREVEDQPPAPADSLAPIPARVAQVARESSDTFTLDVVPVGPDPLPRFTPGQFSMLYVFGVAELPVSISGDPESDRGLTYTIRSVGLATHRLVTRRRDDWIGVRGPFGNGWPVASCHGKDILLVAGGIGLAPLRPVIYHVLHHRKEYGRLMLLYGARGPADLIYRKELRSWDRQSNTQVVVTVDYGGLQWRGHVGVVTTAFRTLRLDPPNTVAMMCGPEVMMRFAALELENRGLERDNLYLSMERNMKCGVGVCGHCQFGPFFLCRDGPVFTYRELQPWVTRYEI